MIKLTDLMEVIVAELFRQHHSDALDAPEVWQNENSRFVHIDGAVNVEKLAMAILAAS
jgi:hypothetical protein